MQIGGISPATQSVLGTTSKSLDGNTSPVPESDAELQDTASVSSSTAVQSPEESVTETAAPQTEAALQTKVVTSADEVLGTGLGSNIDTTA